MPSLKQQILEEFEKNNQWMKSVYYDISGRRETQYDRVYDFLSSSIDKVIETAKGCKTEG